MTNHKKSRAKPWDNHPVQNRKTTCGKGLENHVCSLMENIWKTAGKLIETHKKNTGKPMSNQWITCGKPMENRKNIRDESSAFEDDRRSNQNEIISNIKRSILEL